MGVDIHYVAYAILSLRTFPELHKEIGGVQVLAFNIYSAGLQLVRSHDEIERKWALGIILVILPIFYFLIAYCMKY